MDYLGIGVRSLLPGKTIFLSTIFSPPPVFLSRRTVGTTRRRFRSIHSHPDTLVSDGVEVIVKLYLRERAICWAGREEKRGGGRDVCIQWCRRVGGARARPRMRFIGPDAFYSPQDRWRGSKGDDATMRNPVQLNAYCSHIFESIQPNADCIGDPVVKAPR